MHAESVLITQQSVDELLSVLQHPSAPPAPLDAPAPAKNLHLVVSGLVSDIEGLLHLH